MARAGSQGLPGKHMLPLMGRAVIEYTFDHARGSRLLNRVVISTDCPHISELCPQGIDLIRRPAHLATAEASVQAVMLHAMDVMDAWGTRADALVVLYGNVPVRPEGVIDRAVAHWRETGCDSVRTFCPVGKWHPAWMSRFEEDRVVPLEPGSIHRRQDLAPLHLHDGAAVVVSRASLLRGRDNPHDPHTFFGVDRRGIHTGMGETVEIDHQRDLYWAEAMLRERQSVLKVA